MATRVQQKKKRGSGGLIVWVLLPLIALVAFNSVLLLLIGMAPTLVALFIDKRPEKYAAYCVGGFNLCGAIPYLLKLILGGHNFQALAAILTNPVAWLVMYGAAGIGWAVFHYTPEIALRVAGLKERQQIAGMKKRQEQLVEEWGDEIVPLREDI
ncbi:hypothetical protein ACFSM5_15335 [Lacibacterium aquatile]|uniref:MFS transporter n=1 Tax=Lacibacterium aquatile TaxID=1168082 RepID=A0ABW5DTV5_9PROT